jgi:SNF2 family DNA or RNA helicase
MIQEYVTKYKYEYSRIDGNVSVTDRESRIRNFNDRNSNKLVFLLTTKAGGQGINLQAADTVIIFDSDYNPHNDLQAIGRCHRLGYIFFLLN